MNSSHTEYLDDNANCSP